MNRLGTYANTLVCIFVVAHIATIFAVLIGSVAVLEARWARIPQVLRFSFVVVPVHVYRTILAAATLVGAVVRAGVWLCVRVSVWLCPHGWASTGRSCAHCRRWVGGVVKQPRCGM